MVVNQNGNVGIGTASPGAKLTINGDTSNAGGIRFTSGALEWNQGIMPGGALRFESTGGALNVMQDGGNVGIGTTTPGEKLDVEASGTTVAGFNRTTNDGTIISIQVAGIEQGSISVSGATTSYNAFTGSHYGWTDRTIERGALVTLTGDNHRLHDNADSEIIYGVNPSSIPNDPKILGAYLGLQESQDPAGPDNPHLVMAVGNGVMWVVEDGQNVEIGDHLISSDMAGHAMRDTGEFPVSHIVGIAVQAVDWDEIEESVDGRKHRRISVLFERFAVNHAIQSAQDPGNVELNRVKAELSDLRSEKEELARNNDELRMQLEAITAAVRKLEAMAAVETEVKLAAK